LPEDVEQREPFSLVFGQRDVHTVAVMIEAQASRLLGRGCVRANISVLYELVYWTRLVMSAMDGLDGRCNLLTR
jgi:hypothetical protein